VALDLCPHRPVEDEDALRDRFPEVHKVPLITERPFPV
jgi:hypothetical protein